MSGFRIIIESAVGQFDSEFRNIYRPIAEAGTKALRNAADEAKVKARAHIATAGFSKKWQNAFRAEVQPDRDDVFSARATLVLRHAIPYAYVFEEGATIRGKQNLVIPLSHTPKGRRGARWKSMKSFEANVAPLFSMKMGGKMFLGAKMAIPKAEAKRGAPYRVRKSALGRAKTDRTVLVSVPLFSLRKTVEIKKTLRLQAIIDEAAASIPALYLKNLNTES